MRPLVEDFVFHFPYLGTLMNRIGGVRACPENAERLLTQDQLVAVFPEGIKGIGKVFMPIGISADLVKFKNSTVQANYYSYDGQRTLTLSWGGTFDKLGSK